MDSPLCSAQGVDVAPDNSVYVADTCGAVVVKVTQDGQLTIVAGSTKASGYPTPGPVGQSLLVAPTDVVAGANGSLYIADSSTVLHVDSGALSVIAGIPGERGAPTEGAADKSRLDLIFGLTLGDDGSVYIADGYNCRIERIRSGTLTFAAGNGNCGLPTEGLAIETELNLVYDVAATRGLLYIADAGAKALELVDSQGHLSLLSGG